MSVDNISIEIFNECCSGKEYAWKEFICTYLEYIHSVSANVLKIKKQKYDTGDVEEVTQDVLTKLVSDEYAVLKSWDYRKSKLSTWLTVITRRVAIDWIRHRERRSRVVFFDEDIVAYAAAPDSEPAGDVGDVPEIDLAGLTTRQRTVLELLYHADKDVPEVASALHITAQTVRSLRHQGLQRLRRRYMAA